MNLHQLRADALELARLHEPVGDGRCRCGRELPCAVARAARDALDRCDRIRGTVVGRARVPLQPWPVRGPLVPRPAHRTWETGPPGEPEVVRSAGDIDQPRRAPAPRG